jgi:hypothetical protein
LEVGWADFFGKAAENGTSARSRARYVRWTQDPGFVRLTAEVPAQTWNLFQSDGEQFGGLIASAAGLDGLDCLPEYLFGLGL